MNTSIHIFLSYSFDFIIWFFLTMFVVYVFNYIVATFIYCKLKKIQDNFDFEILLQIKDLLPKITFIIPAYNEEVHILPSIDLVLNNSYPNFDIIVVDNGSTDSTLSLLKEKYELFPLPPVIGQKIQTKKIEQYYKSVNEPKITVIAKKDREKSDGQNAALNLTDSPFFISIDADSLVHDGELLKTILYFLNNPELYAIGSLVGIDNDCIIENSQLVERGFPHHYLTGLQRIDYDMMIVGFRFGHIYNGGTLTIPGAFGLFDREKVMELNGYSSDTLIDDVDLTLALIKKSYLEKGENLVETSPYASILTNAPNTIKELLAQRIRWENGALQIFKKYREMFLSPKYDNIGLLGLPYYFIQIFLASLVQLYTICIIPIAIYTNFYDWKKVILIMSVLITLHQGTYVYLFYIRNITVDRFVKTKEWVRVFFESITFVITMEPLLFYAKIAGLISYLKKSSTWKSTKRRPLKKNR